MAANINASINLSKAEGLITDANYAQETPDLAKTPTTTHSKNIRPAYPLYPMRG